jgi:thymidylate kinase
MDKNKLYIIVEGAQSTGKPTLVKKLYNRFSNNYFYALIYMLTNFVAVFYLF